MIKMSPFKKKISGKQNVFKAKPMNDYKAKKKLVAKAKGLQPNNEPLWF